MRIDWAISRIWKQWNVLCNSWVRSIVCSQNRVPSELIWNELTPENDQYDFEWGWWLLTFRENVKENVMGSFNHLIGCWLDGCLEEQQHIGMDMFYFSYLNWLVSLSGRWAWASQTLIHRFDFFYWTNRKIIFFLLLGILQRGTASVSSTSVCMLLMS